MRDEGRIITPSECISHFRDFEASVPHFYLDGEGIVTFGIGCAIETKEEAMGLELCNKFDQHSATFQEKVEEWQKFKKLELGKDVLFYSKQSTLFGKQTFIELLFTRTLQNIINEVRDKVCELSEFKPAAQLVLLDFAFNLGVRGLTQGFPKFLHAFLVRDWETAAKECDRFAGDKPLKSRNTWTRLELQKLQKEKIS